MIDTLLTIARRYAAENLNAQVASAHLFRAVLHKDFDLTDYIEDVLNKDYYYLLEWAEAQIQFLDKVGAPTSDIDISDEAVAVIDEARNYQETMGLDELTPLCVLASLVTPGVGFTLEQLKTLPLTVQEILDRQPVAAAGTSARPVAAATDSKHKALGKYCIDRTAEARVGQMEPVVGFEREVSSILETLGRKTKANLLIVGEAGVGKSSLLRGFVQRLVGENPPERLSDTAVYELDMGALTAGASYKGEVEDRMKSVVKELQSLPGAILVVESIDKVFDKQDILYGVSTMLKREMNRAGFSLLCTSSVSGFTKCIETDKEFTRQLEKLTLEQPNEDYCFRILKGSIEPYSQYHGLKVSDEALIEAIRLAKRYMAEKSLPDSAFDLIDRTMSQVATMNSVSKSDIEALKNELTGLQSSRGDDLMNQLTWLHYKTFNKISCLLTSQIEDEVDFAKLDTPQARIDYLKGVLAKLKELSANHSTEVLPSDLFAVVAKQTGIPLGKVQSKERDKLVNGEQILKKRVIGQDHAIKVVLDAIYESRSGLNKKGQPMGSFFFLGPTGTGKTELSKSLVEFLFGDEQALIRFDMSEFKEEHSVALLYGAPPGYVGYEEGGLLVNKIRQNPYSVVLFDEIEKAHKSVFDLFLQILDEGKLHDRLGRVGDFSNALILFTSNIGSQYIVDSFGKGVIPSNNDLMDIMQGHFRPEFLGRLTEIVPFAPITEQTVVKIFDIHLRNLIKQMDEQHISLTMDDDTKRAIAMSGFNPQYGARPIIGTIRKQLRRPISTLIIQGKVKSGDTVVAKWVDGKVEFNINQ
ncbi:MAG: ATP-dependent Clp protease ATP-binding subunit [Bacteroidales bacterium]|nr:ATP-dependent Clp protease ATP-binding subunit [Bacteroidales bacterium]